MLCQAIQILICRFEFVKGMLVHYLQSASTYLVIRSVEICDFFTVIMKIDPAGGQVYASDATC